MVEVLTLVWLTIALGLAAAFRLYKSIPGRRAERCAPSGTSPRKISTMVVLGSGGHTAEMFRLLRGLDASIYQPRAYVIANTDSHSKHKSLEFEAHLKDGSYNIITIPRSREVGQSYISSVFTTLYAFSYAFFAVFRFRPHLLICNGPGTCLPVCVAAVILRFFAIRKTQIMYVESICRVEDLSLSARLLYLFISRLLVQWPELVAKYPKAEYFGLLSH